jgi:hypothetical protein
VLGETVDEDRKEKNGADKGVALEESAIDSGEIEMPGTAMFID